MNNLDAILLIVIVSLVTILLRFLPFIIFNGKKETPKIITYLGNVLPFSVMAMLVVYCFKDVTFNNFPYGLPELIAGGSVFILHILKKNTLLSIIGGTAIYMILIQFIFI
ncbi:MAG: AzlD domain-containing protein [Bacilli bacterium]|nr:AzlD domain-containing protein [Bacilli bacterium]